MADRHWKWEYRIATIANPDSAVSLQEWLDREGENGWELVAFRGVLGVFKRAKMT